MVNSSSYTNRMNGNYNNICNQDVNINSKKKVKLNPNDTRFIFNRKYKSYLLKCKIEKNIMKNMDLFISQLPFHIDEEYNQMLQSLMKNWVKKEVVVDRLIYDYNSDGVLRMANQIPRKTNIPGIFETTTLRNGHLNFNETENWNGLRRITNSNNPPSTVMILLGCLHYNIRRSVMNIHSKHAMCAFKHQNILFCFNPWGSAYVNNRNLLPDDQIWEDLKRKYKCTDIVVYTGVNLQEHNSFGLCTGFSINFGSHMFTEMCKTFYVDSLVRDNHLTNTQAFQLLEPRRFNWRNPTQISLLKRLFFINTQDQWDEYVIYMIYRLEPIYGSCPLKSNNRTYMNTMQKNLLNYTKNNKMLNSNNSNNSNNVNRNARRKQKSAITRF